MKSTKKWLLLITGIIALGGMGLAGAIELDAEQDANPDAQSYVSAQFIGLEDSILRTDAGDYEIGPNVTIEDRRTGSHGPGAGMDTRVDLVFENGVLRKVVIYTSASQ